MLQIFSGPANRQTKQEASGQIQHTLYDPNETAKTLAIRSKI